ncbi:MAG: phosphoribosylanthranilate isomerase [Bacteroidetes bacterium]|nr:phosphoribosylanthranilate isomerase [Bacteroidota bacterium]
MPLKVKVCGITLAEQLLELNRPEIDYLGLIFHPSSPRYARHIKLPEVELKPTLTGVFVNNDIQSILATAQKFSLGAVQLHGPYEASDCHELKKAGLQVIKVFHPEDEGFAHTGAFEDCADFFLFDSGKTGSGGSGKQFAWEMLASYKGKVPFFISGGIGPGDAESIRQIRHPLLAGVDLNSRFETQPGIKDINQLTHFIKLLLQ